MFSRSSKLNRLAESSVHRIVELLLGVIPFQVVDGARHVLAVLWIPV